MLVALLVLSCLILLALLVIGSKAEELADAVMETADKLSRLLAQLAEQQREQAEALSELWQHQADQEPVFVEGEEGVVYFVREDDDDR